MPDKALEALKSAYQEQAQWMLARAEEYESGKCQHHAMDGNTVSNKSAELAAEYRYRAKNLEALIASYEALLAKGKASP